MSKSLLVKCDYCSKVLANDKETKEGFFFSLSGIFIQKDQLTAFPQGMFENGELFICSFNCLKKQMEKLFALMRCQQDKASKRKVKDNENPYEKILKVIEENKSNLLKGWGTTPFAPVSPMIPVPYNSPLTTGGQIWYSNQTPKFTCLSTTATQTNSSITDNSDPLTVSKIKETVKRIFSEDPK